MSEGKDFTKYFPSLNLPLPDCLSWNKLFDIHSVVFRVAVQIDTFE